MDSQLILELSAILVLILANGFFALSEFSIIASRNSKLRQKIAKKKSGASTAWKLHNKPDKFLASIQVGITLVGTLAGVFGGATLVNKFEMLYLTIPIEFIASIAKPLSVVSVAIIITIAMVVLGELVPKFVALSNPEKFARYVAPSISFFIKLTSFFALFLSGISNLIIKLFGIKKSEDRAIITEDEINMMILDGREKGIFDETEEQLIKSVFDFADSSVRRAMTPRIDVIAIEINASPQSITDVLIETGFSRLPVYENTIDNIVGILYAKDIIIQKLNPELIIVQDICRKPTFVPDSMPLSKLLSEFQNKKNHMAIVLDEYGGTAGIITLEDVIEELVGEIRDEYDIEDDPLVKHSETVAFADSDVWPGLVNNILDCNLPEDDNDTLAGLFINTLGRLPKEKESIIIADIKMTVILMESNRLLRLKLEKIIEPSDEN
ncbi:MAG: hemolysin family protein [candidate division Zixibacteria bacterium]|nr:hemolysin family protein [candidate division Zixibacteria bacterium]